MHAWNSNFLISWLHKRNFFLSLLSHMRTQCIIAAETSGAHRMITCDRTNPNNLFLARVCDWQRVNPDVTWLVNAFKRVRTPRGLFNPLTPCRAQTQQHKRNKFNLNFVFSIFINMCWRILCEIQSGVLIKPGIYVTSTVTGFARGCYLYSRHSWALGIKRINICLESCNLDLVSCVFLSKMVNFNAFDYFSIFSGKNK